MVQLTVPVSIGNQIDLGEQSSNFYAQGSISNPTPARASRLMVNMDGYGYLAFTQTEWNLAAENCAPGQPLTKDVTLARDHNWYSGRLIPTAATAQSFLKRPNLSNRIGSDKRGFAN